MKAGGAAKRQELVDMFADLKISSASTRKYTSRMLLLRGIVPLRPNHVGPRFSDFPV